MDLWTAPLYYLLGIEIPLFTPLFAASRIAGWSAHYLEVRYVNDEPIIRPRASYVGPEPRDFEATEHHGALDSKYAG
jgi:citrate synthase